MRSTVNSSVYISRNAYRSTFFLHKRKPWVAEAVLHVCVILHP